MECVREAYSVIGEIFLPMSQVVKYALNIHVGYIVSKEYDFVAMNLIEILPLHILQADEPRLEKSGDECPGSGERVEDVDILFCQGCAEFGFEDFIY